MKIAVFGNLCQDHRFDAVSHLFGALSQCGAEVTVEVGFYVYLREKLHGFSVGRSEEVPDSNTDMVVSVGGDGTFLRAAAWVGCREIPILGVNTGHLGYLADVTVDGLGRMAADIAANRFRTESRTLLEVTADSSVMPQPRFALNEVAVLKSASSAMLQMDTKVDGAVLNTYMADGLIVATPTGSTAYNLSVGGPILHPACHSFVISPVAAHSLTMRPLVLPDTAEIRIRIRSERSSSFLLAVDGESLSLPVGTSLKIRKAGHCVKVVLRGEHDFACTLRNKLMWGADSR